MKPSNARGGFLTKDGDGATYNAKGNYSDAGDGAATFEIGPPAGEVWLVRRLLPFIADAGQMSPNEYGDTGSALTNGVVVQIAETGADPVILTGLVPPKTNGEWAAQCHDVVNVGVGSGGADAYSVRWTFENDYGEPLRLIGDKGHKLQVILNDDLTGLTKHYFRMPARLEAP